MEFIALFFLWLGLLSAGFLWKNLFRKRDSTDEFLASEADRCLHHFCEIPLDGWSSRGRLYSSGLAVIKDQDGKFRFVKQKKLCDLGILR